MAHRFGRDGKGVGQWRLHAVPGEVYAALVLKVPVQSHSCIDVVVGADEGFFSLPCQFEVVLSVFVFPDFKGNLPAGTLVDAFQQSCQGGSGQAAEAEAYGQE